MALPWIELRQFLKETEQRCRAAFEGAIVLVAMDTHAGEPIGISIRRHELADPDEDEEVDESAARRSGFIVVDVEKPF